MRVRDTITAQRLDVDEAYQRFFDGFYNLGRPAEVFERTVVMSPPRLSSSQTTRGLRRTRRSRRGGRGLPGNK